jgi:hypothetical protein
VVVWACVTAGGAVVHGHPAYAALLGLTLLMSAAAGWRTRRPTGPRSVRRRAGTAVLLVLAVAWIAVVGWLRPFGAVEPALGALRSDSTVTVTQGATQVVLAPTGGASGTGVFFQPGARVDARAYAAVLRPLAEAGHLVVVAKQPVGIGFLALGAFDAAREDHTAVDRWVLGGHSLGGTVAALQADDVDDGGTAPAVGLLLYASYPADDVSESLTTAVGSVSGTRDGLSTPEQIEASRSDLPPGSTFVVVEGASHAQFGDYGPQPGDGVPTIDGDEARTQIAAASVRFVTGLEG